MRENPHPGHAGGERRAEDGETSGGVLLARKREDCVLSMQSVNRSLPDVTSSCEQFFDDGPLAAADAAHREIAALVRTALQSSCLVDICLHG